MRKGPGTRWLYRLPSHISKTEISTGSVGGATRTVRRMSRRAVAMKKIGLTCTGLQLWGTLEQSLTQPPEIHEREGGRR